MRGDEEHMDVGTFSTAAPIGSSNIGFKMLKKHGWKEGTGLGISEQGRLEPVEAHLKTNKRGLGAERVKKNERVNKTPQLLKPDSDEKFDKLAARKKAKSVSKRMKKMEEIEKQIQEKEFERAFFREFWPDNV